jgi:hypothetical protein
LQLIDKKNFLLNVIKAKGLLKLSPEILRVNQFTQPIHCKDKQELVCQFMICLDFLLKGCLVHWQLKLTEQNKGPKGDALAKKEDALTKDYKFPILLGDQYNSMAYFMITRLGNVELSKLLTHIEEGLQKIFFNIDKFSSDVQENLKFLYEHFYNYIPQFMGNCFKGLGVIYDLDQAAIRDMFEAGI